MTAPTKCSRRKFNAAAISTAVATLSLQFIPSKAWGKATKPTIAAIGIGGKGAVDVAGVTKAGFELAALVDVVDGRKIGKGEAVRKQGTVQAQHADLPFFADYGQMFDQMGDKIDAVTVSTPDHHHFHASRLAILAGKHVYCQKPLTHGLWEARTLAELAKQHGVKTQMGNQAHATDHMRRCVELLRSGLIGKVTEIHGWTNRPIWPQGMEHAPAAEPVPPHLNWEQWIGPAPFVDYSSKLAPFNWRGAWNFGCGALGDMACHILDMGWWAVGAQAPLSVRAEQQGATRWSPPINSKITWQLPQTPYTSDEGCTFNWYDGYTDAHFDPAKWVLAKNGEAFRHPDDSVLSGEDFRHYDLIVVGEHGKLFFNRLQPTWVVKAGRSIDGFKWPEASIPRARGQDNYQEWFDAVTGKIDRSQSDFAVAGPFTEMVLLGTLAQRNPGQTLEWDAAKMAVKNRPDLQSLVHRAYRPGWEVG